MTEVSVHHTPVLAEAVLRMATVKPGDVWVDCTLGFAGHTRLLLKAGAKVLGIDQDQDARASAVQRLASFGDQFTLLPGNFSDLSELLLSSGHSEVDGILADIGVSSYQLDQAARGFSFRQVGPVDMRMDQSSGETAFALITRLTVQELSKLLRQWGEEPFSKPIARAMQAWAAGAGPHDTKTLADHISAAIPTRARVKLKHHPATRSFQALRIAVNDEIGALQRLLDSIPDCLRPGGRALIISFHSLEDRLVKRRFAHLSGQTPPLGPTGRPLPVVERAGFERLSKKPIMATEAECTQNPRARSAKLRGVRKLEHAA